MFSYKKETNCSQNVWANSRSSPNPITASPFLAVASASFWQNLEGLACPGYSNSLWQTAQKVQTLLLIVRRKECFYSSVFRCTGLRPGSFETFLRIERAGKNSIDTKFPLSRKQSVFFYGALSAPSCALLQPRRMYPSLASHENTLFTQCCQRP